MKHAEKRQTNKMQIDKTQMWNFVYLMQLPLGMGPGEKMIHDVDWELMYRLSRKQNVVALGYEAARNYTGTDKPSQELLKKWKALSDQSTMQCLYQQAAQDELAEAFEQAEIPFVFLKGAYLRELYPRPDLRSMADIDVLIHEEDTQKAAGVMKKLEYAEQEIGSRNEDIYYKDPCVTVEVHRQPFWKEKKWNQYLENAWRNTSQESMDSWDIALNLEDYYFYLLGHFIHHLRDNGGVGIKIYLDMELFLHNFNNRMNQQRLDNILNRFGLAKFEQILINLISAWDSGFQREDITQDWTEFVVGSGAYKNVDNFIILNPAFKNNASDNGKGYKVSYIWKRLFPTYQEMCHMYPKAQKGRYTYLWYWTKRIIKNGLMRYPAIKQELEEVQGLDQEKISNLKKLYEDIGIPEKRQ